MLLVLLTAWWFWITLVAVVLLLICEAKESSVFGSTVVLAAILSYQFLGNVDVYGYVRSNPLSIVKWIGIYLVAGVAWGTFKWWLFALNTRDEYREMRREFLASHKIDGDKVPLNLREKWLEKTSWKTDFPPKVDENKSRIIRWMAYWPTSVVWTLLDDFIRRVYTTVYNTISSTLQGLSNRVFDKENDYE